jgi:hypothetical protein
VFCLNRKEDRYEDELARLAYVLAIGENEAVAHSLADGCSLAQVKLFTEGNWEKRRQKLQDQLEFIIPAFDDLEDLLEAYIRQAPLAAYDTGSSDGARFLVWLWQTRPISPWQRDYVRCQQARYQVEDEIRANRRTHVRFQELCSVADRLAAELAESVNLRIHLNPFRVWSRFVSRALLDEEAHPPAVVLFFPVRSDIHTALLEAHGRALVRELARFEPCTLLEWAGCSTQAGREELVDFCQEASKFGFVAFS